MSKIIIPNGMFKIGKNHDLKFNPDFGPLPTVENPCTLFNNENNHYVLNVLPKAHHIFEHPFWALLNVKGKLEVNFPSHFSLNLGFCSTPKVLSSEKHNPNAPDICNVNELVFNSTSEFRNTKNSVNLVSINQTPLKKITVNYDQGKFSIFSNKTVEELNVNSSKLDYFVVQCQNLKQLNIPNLKSISNNDSYDYKPTNFDFAESKMPSNCLIKMNKNILANIIYVNPLIKETWEDPKYSLHQKPLIEVLKDFNYTSFAQDDKYFTVPFGVLKKCLQLAELKLKQEKLSKKLSTETKKLEEISKKLIPSPKQK